MLEITPDDIANLNDEDLRSLVGRLCEAEVLARGLQATGVTWGGNQNAADGGIDVRVELPEGAALHGFLPRRAIGFQVKKSDMPLSAIAAEMRPNGTIRPSIRQLADRGGAYITVSSGANVSDSVLNDRRDAMAQAVGDVANAPALFLDFYDRSRLATWMRAHAGVNDTQAFDIPIWVPKETPEEDLIPKARASLHEFISRIADQTAGWKK